MPIPPGGFDASADLQGVVEKLAKLEEAADRRLRWALKQGADEVAVHAKQNHEYRDRTGRLTQSIHAENVQGNLAEGFRVDMISGGLRVQYAAHIEFGTRPHIIQARRARMLRFIQNGKTVFRYRVRHPGNRPYRFMRNALEAKLPRIEKLMETALELAYEESGL